MSDLNDLTDGEIAVLRELARHGGTNREIAERLGLALPTVKTHLHNASRALRRADGRSSITRTGMAVWFLRQVEES